jgi:hypothetical protein
MRPRDVVQAWIDAFNRADVGALSALYHADAVNHQVAESPVEGREAIRAMFAAGFAAAEMVCIPENLFEDGEWAILEWRDETVLLDLDRRAVCTKCGIIGADVRPNWSERPPPESLTRAQWPPTAAPGT